MDRLISKMSDIRPWASKMDKLDIKIIRELFQPTPFAPSREGQRKSFRKMGKKLGVGGGAVAKREERLVRSGFIKGFPLFLNMNLLGLKVGALVMDVGASTPRRQLADKLSLFDGVLIVQTHVEGSIGIVFCCEDHESLHRKADLISTLAGARSRMMTRVPFPESAISLKKTDWNIISKLEGNVDKSLKEISEELNLHQDGEETDGQICQEQRDLHASLNERRRDSRCYPGRPCGRV